MTKKTKARTGGHRAWTAGIAVAAVVIVGITSVIRVSRAEVEIPLAASELRFTLDSAGALTRPIEVDSTRLFELSGLRVTDYRGQPEALVKTSVAGISRAGRRSRITLGALRAERGSEVHVEAPAQRSLPVVLQASGVGSTPTFAADAPIEVSTPSRRDTLRGTNVRALTAVRTETGIRMKVDPSDTMSSLFAGALFVRKIELHRLSRDGAIDSQSGQRNESVLRTIRVRFPGLDMERAVDPTEIVKLTVVEKGVLRGLRVTPRGVEGTFSGAVSAMSFDGQSVMPTWLDVFANKVHLRALYLAIIFVATAMLSLYRFWRGPG